MAERGVKLAHLRAWRERRLMTQSELAKAARVSLFTVARAEHGGVASYATVKALAKALDVTPDDLFMGRGPLTVTA